MFTCITNSAEETADLSLAVSQRIHEGDVLCLNGELGAGKTLFAKTLAETLGVEGEVTSPTFSLMNIYEGVCPIVHFDLYRLENEEELEDIGFAEYVSNEEGIVLIEWAEKFPEALPEEYIEINIERLEGDSRRFSFRAVGEKNQALIEELSKVVTACD